MKCPYCHKAQTTSKVYPKLGTYEKGSAEGPMGLMSWDETGKPINPDPAYKVYLYVCSLGHTFAPEKKED